MLIDKYFKVFLESASVLFPLYALVSGPWGMWDHTRTPCVGW